MKQTKKLFLMLLAVILVIGIFPVSAQAGNRQYQIRIYTGNKGYFGGVDTEENHYYSDSFSDYSKMGHSYPSVTTTEKYYVKGLKESGKDTLLTGFTTTKDQDYIVAYGIKGQEVRYIVRYLEYGTNAELAEEQVFYADVGDQPVSSYIYIEGYETHLRTKKTLVEDESQNVLYCYYTKIPAAATGGGGGGGGAGGGNANAGGNAGNNANAGNANADANANANAGDNNANADNNAGTAANGTDNTAQAQQPAQQQSYAQLEDIMDLDVPLASFEDIIGSAGSSGSGSSENSELAVGPDASASTQQNTKPKLLSKGLLIFFIVLFFCLIALLYWYLLFYRKKKKYADVEVVTFAEDEEEDDDFDIESFRCRHSKRDE